MQGYSRHARAVFVRSALLVAAVSAAVVLLLAQTRPGQWLESGTYDARVRWSPKSKVDPRIVIVDIDNASFDALKEKLTEGGRWPLTRRVWTELVRYIAPGKPRAIVFDAIFGGRETEEIDARFASLIRESGTVVLAYTLSPASMDVAGDGGAAASKLKLLDREAAPAAADVAGVRLDPKERALNTPEPMLGEAAAGLGCINAELDPDGVVRRVALQYVLGRGVLRALSLRTADLVSGNPNGSFRLERRTLGLLGTYAVRGEQRIPVDGAGSMVLQWHGDSFAYPRIPLGAVICSMYPAQCPEQAAYYKPEFFRDKIVLIGASTTASYDVHPTPFAEAAPGFVAHATAIDNLLRGEAVTVAPSWVLWAGVIMMALAAAWVLIRIASGIWDLALAAAILLAYAGAAWGAFAAWHLWLALVAPMSAMLISYFSCGVLRYATVGRDLRRTRGTLDRYISPQLVNYVLENLDRVQLRGERRELTILFSDVRNFTTLTEGSDPVELLELLNDYLAAMTEIIFKYDGVVDKFIGDGILAYWGAFTPGKNHALLAAQAALEMLERLKELNRRWAGQGRPQIAIGIGLNTGEVIFGNVGSGKKIEFTVIGDPVNLASRLEGLNKEFKTSIIVSEFTQAKLGELARVRPLGAVKVKGKTVETAVFELQGLNEQTDIAVQAAGQKC